MKNYWIKSGILSLLEKVSIQGFALVSVILLLKMMPQEDFGVWALFFTITAVIEVARIGLLQNALVKYLTTSSDEDYPKISTASLFLNIAITAIIVVALLALSAPIAGWLDIPVLKNLLRIYALTNISLVVFFQFNYIQQANLDFKGIFWAAFARQSFFLVFVACMFFTVSAISLEALAYAQIVGALLGSIVGYIYCKPFLRFSKEIDFSWVKTLYNFGIFVFGTNLNTQLYKSADKFLLAKIPGAGVIGVAIYEQAIKLANLTDIPTLSMASILFPQSSRTHEGEDGNAGVKDLYEKAVGAILAMMIPAIVFVMIFAELLVGLLTSFNPEYASAANILRVTILYGLFIPYAVQFGTVVDSIGKPKINFYFTIFNLMLLIVIDYFFITKFGTIGAAYGTLLTYAITFVIMQVYLRKELNINCLKPILYVPFFYKMGYSIIKNKLTGSTEETVISFENTPSK